MTSQGASTVDTKSFSYDVMGNRTVSTQATASDTANTTYAPNRLNQYSTLSSSWGGGANSSASSLGYDQSGNLTQWTSVATGAGTASNTQYVYDDADRLTSVVTRNPSTLVNQSKSEFQYDGLSRLRISTDYSWNGTSWVVVANSEKRRIYDGMNVVEERNSGNSTQIRYTRDGNIGGILAKKSNTGNYYYFQYDGSGNVVGLTDSNQASVAEYSYDAFGNTLSATGTQASGNAYRYSTKEYFGNIGLYNYGYRFYSPGMGRWINRDPLREAGGLNLYTAMANNPVNNYDAYGLQYGGFGEMMNTNPSAAVSNSILTGSENPSLIEKEAALNSLGEDIYEHSPVRGLSVSGSIDIGKYGGVGVEGGWSVDGGFGGNGNAQLSVATGKSGNLSPAGVAYGYTESSGGSGQFLAGHSQGGGLGGNSEGGSWTVPLGMAVGRGKVKGGAAVNIGIDPNKLSGILPGSPQWDNPSSDSWELPSAGSPKKRGKNPC